MGLQPCDASLLNRMRWKESPPGPWYYHYPEAGLQFEI